MTRNRSYTPRSLRRLEKKGKRNLYITIALVIFGSYLLLSWGLPALIGGLNVFNKFKKVETVAKVTEDTAIAPPFLNIPYEATNTSKVNISGYAAENSEIELYIDEELKATTDTNSDGNFNFENVELLEGTNNIYGKTIIENKKSLPSKNIKVILSLEKPKLEVSEPQDNITVSGGGDPNSSAKKIKVSGKTDSENTVTVNGASAIVNNEGKFSKEITLNDGENIITVISLNSFGNSTKIEKKVTYTP